MLKLSRAIFFAISILNPNYDVINDVISDFAKVVERCGFHHWIAQRLSWGDVVSVFLYLKFSTYDVINHVIMSDAMRIASPAVNHVA